MTIRSPASAPSPLSPLARRLAPTAVVILMLAYLGVFLAGLPVQWRSLGEVCTEPPCAVLRLEPADADALSALGLSMAAYATFQIMLEIVLVTVLTMLAGLLIWRRRDTWFSLLVSLGLLTFGASFLSEGDAALARLYPELALPLGALEILAFIQVVWIFLAFPNGQLVPRWSGLILATVLVLALGNITLIGQSGSLNPLRVAFLLVYMFGVLTGVAGQVYRFRRLSNSLERQQTKWVLFGLTFSAVALVSWALVYEFFTLPAGQPRVLFNTFGMLFLAFLLLALPGALALSILRYRLWDVDLLIRRTLIYGALTATLVFVYFGVVVALQGLLRAVTGEGQSEISVVLSTLTIAALFVPVRRRLQEAIDRRFYRRRYDAAQVLREFGSGLRDEVELDPLVNRLLGTVDRAMQPEVLGLWLQQPARKAEDG